MAAPNCQPWDKETKNQATGGFNMTMNDAELGASPQLSKGGVFTKRMGGGKMSPLQHSDKFKLGRRN